MKITTITTSQLTALKTNAVEVDVGVRVGEGVSDAVGVGV